MCWIRCFCNTKNVSVIPKGYLYPQPSEAQFIGANYISVQSSLNTSISIGIQVFQIVFFQMPTTKTHKSKASKSREVEMLSNLENMGIMLGSNHFEWEDSEFGNSARWHEISSYNAIVDHNTNSYSISGEIRRFAGNGHSSGNWILVVRQLGWQENLVKESLKKWTDWWSVSLQIQRAISEAINEQVLPQIQVWLRCGSGQMPQERWSVPTGKLMQRIS